MKTLEELETRRVQIARDLEEVQSELGSAQRRLVAGEASASDVADAQSRAHALTEALASVEAEAADERARLAADSADSEREAKIAHALDVAARGASHLADFEAEFAAVNAALRSAVEKIAAVYAGIERARVEHRDAVAALMEMDTPSAFSPYVGPGDAIFERRLAAFNELRRRGAQDAFVSVPESLGTDRKLRGVEPFGSLIAGALMEVLKQPPTVSVSPSGAPSAADMVTWPDDEA